MGVFRLLLALLVVYAHCEYPFGRLGVSAENAVEIFYMISGFYMTLVLRDRYAKPEGAGVGNFYASRALRIFPAYFIVAGVTLFLCFFGRPLLGWAPQAEYYVEAWRDAGLLDGPRLLWLALTQLSMLGLESFNFLTIDHHGHLALTAGVSADARELWRLLLVPQAWSLSVELYFYLLAPFIVTRGRKFLVAVALASFAVRVVLWQIFDLSADPWSYRFFPSEVMFFMLGAIACDIYMRRRDGAVAPSNARVGVICLLAFMAVVSVVIGQTERPYGVSHALAPLVTAAAFVGLPYLFERTRTNKWDRAVGELSYPVYILHMLVIWIVGAGTFEIDRSEFLLVLVLGIGLAIALYRWVDQPMDRFRHRMTTRKQAHETVGRPFDVARNRRHPERSSAA